MKKITRQFLSAFLAALLLLALSATALAEPVADTPVQEGEQTQPVPNTELSSDFKLALSNDKYELYYKAATAEIAVKEKETSVIFYSNPQDRDQTAAVGSDAYSALSSQIVTYYYDELSLKKVDSFTQSANEGQVYYTEGDTSLSVKYEFGIKKFVKEMIPKIISRERMENEILPKLDEAGKKTVLKEYATCFKEEMEKNAFNTLKALFPIVDEHDIYYFVEYPAVWKAEKVYNELVKAGYHEDQLQQYCDENKIENEYEPPVSFTFNLTYTLNDDGFSVSLDTDNIGYDQEFPPIRVEILPFFETAGTEQEGYMFVPDGQGALIQYNNHRVTADQYWKRFFAEDSALNIKELSAQSEYSVLPVYGAYDTDSGYFASVDKGYEYGGVIADIAEKTYKYNFVSGFFDVIAHDVISINGKNNDDDTNIKYAPRPVSGSIEISYHLFSHAVDYNDLAIGYRQHLKNNGLLNKTATDDSAFNIEVFGTAAVKKNFLGFLYNKLEGLAKYNEVSSMVDGLGFSNVDVNYVNAVNGGKEQTTPDKIKPLSAIGSKKDRLALDEKINDLSFSVAVRRAKKASKKNSSISFSREIARIYDYDFISKYFNRRKFSVLLNPAFIDKQIKSLPKSLEKQKITAINLTDAALKIDSDFNLKNYVERKQTREKMEQLLKAIDQNANLSVEYGSIYAFNYIDKIYDMPTTSSQYSILDAEVPFYAMVIRGSVPYVTDSINTADDSVTAFLQSVEIGAEIQYSWVMRNFTDLVDIYENYYNCLYQNSIDQAKDFGAKINDLFAKIGHSEITAHKAISKTLKRTDFASGHTVYVNYSTQAVEVDGYTVEPESFLCVETANS